MLKNIKIRTKIILVPALAGIGFLIIFLINTFFGAQNNQLISRIEQGYYPALEMSRNLEDILANIQRNMQYTVSAQDEDALSASDTLRDKFQTILKANFDNEV